MIRCKLSQRRGLFPVKYPIFMKFCPEWHEILHGETGLCGNGEMGAFKARNHFISTKYDVFIVLCDT